MSAGVQTRSAREEDARDQGNRWQAPEQGCGGREWRAQQNELAIARHQKLSDRAVAIPRSDALAHKAAEVASELGIGIVDGLVLANEAAQFSGKLPRARLLVRVLKLLAGLNGEGRSRKRERTQQEGAAGTACSFGRLQPLRPASGNAGRTNTQAAITQ